MFAKRPGVKRLSFHHAKSPRFQGPAKGVVVPPSLYSSYDGLGKCNVFNFELEVRRRISSSLIRDLKANNWVTGQNALPCFSCHHLLPLMPRPVNVSTPHEQENAGPNSQAWRNSTRSGINLSCFATRFHGSAYRSRARDLASPVFASKMETPTLRISLPLVLP